MNPEFRELGVVKVASPCKMAWSSMRGDDRMRFCGKCRKNVYNLSDMTADEARTLFKQTTGGLCVRFWARSDGTVLTADCPRGAARRAWLNSALAFVASLVAVFPLGYLRRAPHPAAAHTAAKPVELMGGMRRTFGKNNAY
jgi:hypothetical protein